MLKEVGLVSSVASPQVMEALSVDCDRLREAISHTKDLIHLKREERDKGLLKVIRGQDLNLLIFLLRYIFLKKCLNCNIKMGIFLIKLNVKRTGRSV